MSANKFRADVLEVQNELLRAEAALNIRRYDLAIELLHKLLKDHPENTAIFYTLARAFIYKKNYAEACRAVRESLRLDPGSSKSHTLHGNILSNLGQFREAEAAYRTSLELEPTNAYTHYIYAALLVDKRIDLTRAEAHAAKALELDPAAALHHVTMAKILGLQKQYAEAEWEFNRALRLDPENVIVHRVYGYYLLYQRNQPAQAVEYLKQALRHDPNDTDARKCLMTALKAKQRWYALNWYILRKTRRKRSRALFLLALVMLIFSLQSLLGLVQTQNELTTLLNANLNANPHLNPLYRWILLLLLFLVLAGYVYTAVIEGVLNELNKRGRLK